MYFYLKDAYLLSVSSERTAGRIMRESFLRLDFRQRVSLHHDYDAPLACFSCGFCIHALSAPPVDEMECCLFISRILDSTARGPDPK